MPAMPDYVLLVTMVARQTNAPHAAEPVDVIDGEDEAAVSYHRCTDKI